MKKIKKVESSSQISLILLLVTVISALSVLFIYMTQSRSSTDSVYNTSSGSVIIPISSEKEIDLLLKELNSTDVTGQINSEINKLNQESRGI